MFFIPNKLFFQTISSVQQEHKVYTLCMNINIALLFLLHILLNVDMISKTGKNFKDPIPEILPKIR
jgi:hypothetical protein